MNHYDHDYDHAALPFFTMQFDAAHPLYSKITRSSINALKEFFKTDVTKEEWQLIIKMKKVMNID
jgi:translation initiation factor 5B